MRTPKQKANSEKLLRAMDELAAAPLGVMVKLNEDGKFRWNYAVTHSRFVPVANTCGTVGCMLGLALELGILDADFDQQPTARRLGQAVGLPGQSPSNPLVQLCYGQGKYSFLILDNFSPVSNITKLRPGDRYPRMDQVPAGKIAEELRKLLDEADKETEDA